MNRWPTLLVTAAWLIALAMPTSLATVAVAAEPSCASQQAVTAHPVRAPGATTTTITFEDSRADLSNRAQATFTICLDDGTVRGGRGWCEWSEDRRSVESVEAPDVRLRGREWSVSLGVDDIRGPVFQVWGMGRSGYDSARGGTVETGLPLTREGQARFSDIPGRGRAEGDISGRFAWQCDAPPPRKRGHTHASITVTLTGPMPASVTSTGYCVWVDRPDGRLVEYVDAYSPRVPTGDDRYLGVTITLEPGMLGPRADAHLHVSDAAWDRSEDWTGADVIAASTTDLGRGTVRSVGLHPDEVDEHEPPSFLDPAITSATIGWDCGAAPERAAGLDDGQVRPSVPGRLALDLVDAPIRLSVPADCNADREDRVVTIRDVMAELVIDGHHARFVWDDWQDAYLLLLHDEQGASLGEYVAETAPGTDTFVGDDGRAVAGPLHFQPGLGIVQPALFGATTPEPLTASVTIDCPVPAYWEAMGGYDYLGSGETLAEVVDAADLVVIGRPVDVEPLQGRPGDGTAAKDLVTVRIEDVLKGRPRTNRKDEISLEVRRPPDIGDDLVEAILPRGRVLLFLRAVDPPSGPGVRYELINPGQGVVRDFDEVVGVMPDVGPDTFPGDWADRSFDELVTALRKRLR